MGAAVPVKRSIARAAAVTPHRISGSMRRLAATLLVAAIPLIDVAAGSGRADGTAVEKYLARPVVATQYRATRRLEATGSGQRGWLDARTEFSPAAGMHYEVTAEGGSGLIRSRILRSLLEQEKTLIAKGDADTVAIDATNYRFADGGTTGDGLVRVLLEPRRKHRALIAGAMFLSPDDGDLVRVEGRLAKSPSFWLKKVEVVRTYARINGVLVPIALQSTAQVRLLGGSSLHMTYDYSEVNDGPVVTP
jgi:hypothetical protein